MRLDGGFQLALAHKASKAYIPNTQARTTLLIAPVGALIEQVVPAYGCHEMAG
jgi:hypothetical protein